MSGLDFQRRLAETGVQIPIVIYYGAWRHSHVRQGVERGCTLGKLAEIANDAGAFAVGVARPEHTVSGSRKQPASVGANQQRKRARS
jgi:hypothetical protein